MIWQPNLPVSDENDLQYARRMGLFTMLKDRKFWTGMLSGVVLAGSVALLGPLYAAPPAGPTEVDFLKAMVPAIVKIRDNGTTIQSDVAAMKASVERMEKNIEALSKSQGLNTSQSK